MDTIGLHADDERSLYQDYPILSLSWGGTRRFLFRRKQPPPPSKQKEDHNKKGGNATTKHGKRENNEEAVVELWLEDGDLLVMGGTCQKTHKHEVPKWRPTKDPPTSNRINWTLRAFRSSSSSLTP